MNSNQTTNKIDGQTVLLGSLTPVSENQTTKVMTGLRSSEYNAPSVNTSQECLELAVTQWLADARDDQDSQISLSALSTRQQLGDKLSESQLPKRKFRATLPDLNSKPTERFVASQRWEGIVLAIHEETFDARLVSLQGEQKGEQFAEIYRDEVDTPDLSLLQVGAHFYWSIGYLHKKNGNTLRASILRFRRMPPLSEEAVQEAEELAEKWGNLFSDPN